MPLFANEAVLSYTRKALSMIWYLYRTVVLYLFSLFIVKECDVTHCDPTDEHSILYWRV